MANSAEYIPHLDLLIPAQAMERFTTLLQSGIIIEKKHPISVGEFLTSLPGFSPQYITNRVETIFLDGLPVDDLEKLITCNHSVLAISAAMPGLAGAIFRKNSFHAALRTPEKILEKNRIEVNSGISVLLKLFNVVAREKGEALLTKGCLIYSETLLKLIQYRPQLISEVLQCMYEDKSLEIGELESRLQFSGIIFFKVLADASMGKSTVN